MYSEDELLPISALQHLVFCERQWALIHLEQLWTENILTAQGRIMHERVHETEREARGGIIIARGLSLRSLKLGLVGKADVVEFIAIDSAGEQKGIRLDGQPGLWKPFPVEYKRGKPKIDRSDEIQLCAQALCLEEMLKVTIFEGALFYGQPHRRSIIKFNDSLKADTEKTVERLHTMTRTEKTPEAVFTKKCISCSFYDSCLPKSAGGGKSATAYVKQMIEDIEK